LGHRSYVPAAGLLWRGSIKPVGHCGFLRTRWRELPQEKLMAAKYVQIENGLEIRNRRSRCCAR
jgi:hypothetical protein